MHIRACNHVMKFAWDREKAVTLADDRAVEDRFVTVGTDALGRILVVVYAGLPTGDVV